MKLKIIDSHKTFDTDLLNKFQDKYQLKLPKEFIDFLKEHNGGYPDPNVFDFDMDGLKNQSIVQSFLSMTDGEIDGLFHYMELYMDRIPKSFMPFAFDPGGNLILMGIEKTNQGQIFFWDHENEAEPDEEAHQLNIHFIADDLNEFLSNFHRI